MITLIKIERLQHVTTSLINNLFKKLDEIRQKFNISKTFSTEVAVKNDYVTPTYPTKLKEDIQILADNSSYIKRPEYSTRYYISNYYPNQIEIPNVKDYIMALESYNDYVDIINQLDGLCVDCSDYANYSSNYVADYTSDYRSDHNSDCPSNYTNYDSSCDGCSTAQGCCEYYSNNYCQACAYDTGCDGSCGDCTTHIGQ